MRILAISLVFLLSCLPIAQADFNVDVGNFTSPTSTGDSAVTGVGFVPKLLIFTWSSSSSATPSGATAAQGISACENATEQGSAYMHMFDTSSSYTYRGWDIDDRCIEWHTGTFGTPTESADWVSYDSDGFTLNWSVASSTAYYYSYIALGGSDLAVDMGSFNINTSTGNQAITGVGFQPDAIILFTSFIDTSAGGHSNSHMSMGFGTSSSARAAVSVYADNGTGPTDFSTYQTTTDVTHMPSTSQGTRWEADLVSLDSDGFTLNVQTAPGSAAKIFFIALQGVSFKVGSFAQPASTGSDAETGVGFQPSGIIFLSGSHASSASVQTGENMAVGFAENSSEEVVTSTAGDDNVSWASNVTDRRGSDALSITHITAGTPTVDAEADFTSFDSDGFTINWSTADGTARENYYLAFGASGGAPASTFKAQVVVS